MHCAACIAAACITPQVREECERKLKQANAGAAQMSKLAGISEERKVSQQALHAACSYGPHSAVRIHTVRIHTVPAPDSHIEFPLPITPDGEPSKATRSAGCGASGKGEGGARRTSEEAGEDEGRGTEGRRCRRAGGAEEVQEEEERRRGRRRGGEEEGRKHRH